MIADLQMLLALKLTLERVVDGGAWPNARQGEDAVNFNLAGVNLEVWNDAYMAKLQIAGGASVTVDLRNFTDLLFETGKSLDYALGMVATFVLDDETQTDATLVIKPGAANGLQWFFTATDEGVRLLEPGELFVRMAPVGSDGFVVDATHKTLTFSNPGTDDLTATIIIPGGAS